MKDNNIYIDFEAISSPFNRDIVRMEFPYAYSLGIFVGDEFKVKTFIFDFRKFNPNNIDRILRYRIQEDVRELTNDWNLIINRDTTQFISYSPGLERKILSKVYHGVKVIDISEGLRISIATATKEYIEKNKYFKYLRDFVSRNVDEEYIESRGLKKDGALAAIAGYYLYMAAHNKKSKFMKEDIDVNKLLDELSIYSKDDVIRMKFITENKEDVFRVAKEIEEFRFKIKKVSNKIRDINFSLKSIKDLDPSMTIKEYIKELELNKITLEKEKDELEIQKNNI